MPKSKPILLGILYRPPDKSDFVKHINNVFTETGVLDKQECYLLGDLNINLILEEKEIFSNKRYMTFTCLNKAYQDIIFELSEVIDLLSPSKKLRQKANSKPWIDNFSNS